MKIPYGGPGEIPPVKENVPADMFENVIRKFGVVNTCEWFGYAHDSEFTHDTIQTLLIRSKQDKVHD